MSDEVVEPDDAGELVSKYRLPLLAFIERRLGPAIRTKVEPDDILQEVSIEAVRCWPAMRAQLGAPFSWLCGVAERRIVDAHRRFFGAEKRNAGREVSLARGGETSAGGLLNLLVASLTTPTQAISRDNRHALLQEALARLPVEQQDALRLRYIEKLPSKDIAAQLGKSDGAVRVMLTRALKSLQTLLVNAGVSRPG
ncbi:MAG TPA: sigma-70 family RNA polymerase sigma factor [Pirellulales bacterium]|jgi:RNA polymerase sigma-70 factor (ECF subfamily)|nr:sigma-70 family RNA polymerase sigma factor [Pirellulales bacterium]